MWKIDGILAPLAKLFCGVKANIFEDCSYIWTFFMKLVYERCFPEIFVFCSSLYFCWKVKGFEKECRSQWLNTFDFFMRLPAVCRSACFALGGAALPRRQKWADLLELLLGMDHKLTLVVTTVPKKSWTHLMISEDNPLHISSKWR